MIFKWMIYVVCGIKNIKTNPIYDFTDEVIKTIS